MGWKYSNKDMVVAASWGLIVGAMIAPLWAMADNLSAFALALFYAGINGVGGRISTMFWCALACVVLGYLTTFLTGDDAKPVRKRRVKRSSGPRCARGRRSGTRTRTRTRTRIAVTMVAMTTTMTTM